MRSNTLLTKQWPGASTPMQSSPTAAAVDASEAREPESTLPLSRLADGAMASIARITEPNPELRKRLYALGFVPGATVTKLRTAPLGDPLQVRIGGSAVSIRAREAHSILVSAASRSVTRP